MRTKNNVDLRLYSTMRLGGAAKKLATVYSAHELIDAIRWAKQHKHKWIVIGEGSNIIWADDGYNGLVIVNRISGFSITKEDDEHAYVKMAAGENWDDCVARTVAAGLSGIECLSLIPGTAGATPVQNVGAYGQDISHVLINVEAYDSENDTVVNIPDSDCQFGYRTSIFNGAKQGRFAIISITLRLNYQWLAPPFYASLDTYLQQHNISDFSPQNLRDAVVAIRASKLPDPKHVANNGSFFANPIIDTESATKLLQKFPDMPHWDAKKGIKLSAAWLMEQVGYTKGIVDTDTGMGTWKHQALVLVNVSAKTTADLLAFRNRIIHDVRRKFGIELKQEPAII